jgi:hypothetical protein
MMDSFILTQIFSNPQPASPRWPLWLGFILKLVGFILGAGLLLTMIFHNLWWLAWSGFVGLFFGGIVMTALLGTGSLWYGFIATHLYLAAMGLIYVLGKAAEVWLPPWPSLPHHATTYFFLAPPAMILAGALRLGVSNFHKDGRLIWLRLTPILAALSVIILFTFRPAFP